MGRHRKLILRNRRRNSKNYGRVHSVSGKYEFRSYPIQAFTFAAFLSDEHHSNRKWKFSLFPDLSQWMLLCQELNHNVFELLLLLLWFKPFFSASFFRFYTIHSSIGFFLFLFSVYLIIIILSFSLLSSIATETRSIFK